MKGGNAASANLDENGYVLGVYWASMIGTLTALVNI